ncbi:hypothetical protein H8959_000943 [Pygathrix nigripes]
MVFCALERCAVIAAPVMQKLKMAGKRPHVLPEKLGSCLHDPGSRPQPAALGGLPGGLVSTSLAWLACLLCTAFSSR